MRRGRLILICGLPGAGKTTLAKQLASRVDAVRLSPDEWKHALGIDYYDDDARILLEDQLWQLAIELLTSGQAVIMENGFWTRKERDHLRLAARSLGVTVELHYLQAPVGELWRRLEHRNRDSRPGIAPISRDDLQKWAAHFEAPDAAELGLFDHILAVPLAARPPRGATLITAVTESPSATRSRTRTSFLTGST